MTKYIGHAILLTAMAVGVSGVAQAGNDTDECSDSTLQGLYEFNASGFNVVAGVAQPIAILELIRFNGDGTLTVPKATVSINGAIVRSPPNGVGIYTVAADCTGTLSFGPPGPTFDIVVTPRGSSLYIIRTGPGTPALQGRVLRLSP